MAQPDPAPPRQRRSGRLGVVIGAAVVALAVLVVAVLVVGAVHSDSPSVTNPGETSPASTPTPTTPPSKERARELLGPPRSGETWSSGIWASGDTASGARVEEFGRWRGEPVDAITMYPAYKTWAEMSGSVWHITTFSSSPATLVYGLPMLPSNDEGSFATIIAGDHDAVYTKIASDLVAHGRSRSVVRIGWEANGDWFPWNATASDAPQYRAAFRHIAMVLHATAPDLIIDFDVGCGTVLRGQQDRLDALNLLYPGDDVVDLVGCDTYDWYTTVARDEQTWQRTVHPPTSVGIGDVAEFARAHGKGMSVPEWGLASKQAHGLGDNPYFITKMREFFEANADIMVLESYFSEPDTTLANSIWDPAQLPKSSRLYQRLW